MSEKKRKKLSEKQAFRKYYYYIGKMLDCSLVLRGQTSKQKKNYDFFYSKALYYAEMMGAGAEKIQKDLDEHPRTLLFPAMKREYEEHRKLYRLVREGKLKEEELFFPLRHVSHEKE